MDLAKSSPKSVQDKIDAKLKQIEEAQHINSRPSFDDAATQASFGAVLDERLFLLLDELRINVANLQFLGECKDKHAGNFHIAILIIAAVISQLSTAIFHYI